MWVGVYAKRFKDLTVIYMKIWSKSLGFRLIFMCFKTYVNIWQKSICGLDHQCPTFFSAECLKMRGKDSGLGTFSTENSA